MNWFAVEQVYFSHFFIFACLDARNVASFTQRSMQCLISLVLDSKSKRKWLSNCKSKTVFEKLYPQAKDLCFNDTLKAFDDFENKQKVV